MMPVRRFYDSRQTQYELNNRIRKKVKELRIAD